MVKPDKTKHGANDKSFDELLSGLSLRLLKVNPRNIDNEIRQSIMEIGEHYCCVDRVDLRKISEDRSLTTLLHWWIRSDEIGLFADLPNDQIPWAASLILRGEVVRIGRLANMPAEAAAERAILERDGLCAVMLVPLTVNEQVYGSLFLASREEREWSDEVVHQSRLLGDILAVSYARAQRYNAMWASEDRFRAVLENQSVGRDIAGQKRAEEAQDESESRYRNLVENTADWIWEMNLDLEHTYSNKQLEVILGYTTDELRELSLEQLLHPEDLLAVEQRLPNLIDSKSGWEQWELRFRHKNGGYRHLQSSATPVLDTGGNLCGFRGIDRDITDSVMSRGSIEKSERKYRTVVESANDSIWLLNGERISDCNNKALEIFQCDREELIGKKPWDTDISPDYQPDGSTSKDLGRAILKDVRSGISRRFDWTHLASDGTAIDMEISLTPIELIDDGLRLLAVGRDATDARRAQREIGHKSEFQVHLADLSRNLLSTRVEDIYQRVKEELGRIGVQYELRSVGIWLFSGGKIEAADRYIGWRQEPEDWPPQSYQLQRDQVPWFANRVLNGEIIQIDDVGDLPENVRTDQATFQSWGALSLLGIPARVENRVSGCCIFNSSEQRNWEVETVQELGLIADAITSACFLHQATDNILRSEQDLVRSQEVARVGSYSFVPDGSNADFPPKGKLELSSQFCELYGLDEGETSLEQVVSRIHPDDSVRVLNSIRNSIESGTRIVETYRVVRPDGTVLYLENRPHNVTGKSGPAERLFGTVQDVTERIESRNKIERAFAEIKKLKDQLQEENLYLRDEIRVAHGFDKIIGNSAQLRKALMAAEKVAPTDVPVLILGETGTGKELIAQSIHDLSGRKDHALITVNCAALSRDLIESELFGHEKGAFTGAHSQRKGRFELADGGTLFLDEVGELQGELQAKLLRVLQAGEFERLGGSTTLAVDVRLIAATNKNLQRAVDDGDFRADLYYRIATFPIELPPLRERQGDISTLAEFLVRKHAKRMGKDIQSISARTIRYLTNQRWPGNVRELEGFIQRALISAIGPVLDYSESDDFEPESSTSSESVSVDESADLRNVEHQHILKVLNSVRWVIDGKRGAAFRMGVAPSTLRSKMKRLGIKRPA